MSATHSRHFTAAHRPAMRSPLGLFTEALVVWQQRRVLARLDDARLYDIGLSRADAQREAKRPLWDVPNGWRA